ncbi:vascular endothelial growth factor A-like [Uloborus diversus]|uniref:vascular endothelial growth factor A-like n=1 Tax=Uloborus diversus TaxID=327109 RepID=UPI00240A13C6|nr:vascular endothelial growth factor A-like [Uloborus diversus]
MVPWLTELLLLLMVAAGAVLTGPLERKPQVPEDFLIRLQTVQNFSQFLSSWIDQSAVQRAYLLQGEADEETAVEVAHPAGCIPEMQVVEFERPSDPSLVLWPSCTRVRRCGGCCSSKLLHCVAIKTSTIVVKVIRARYPHPGAELLELEGYESVSLEQHDRCSCRCRQEERDCTSNQRYQPGQCQCVCRNQQEAAQCRMPDHYWDGKDCVCRCKQEPDCSTGMVLNDKSCKCEVRHQTPYIPERMPGPAPHLSTLFRDDGGENDAYRLRYAAVDPHEGPFALFQHKQERTVSVENVTLPQWTVT